MKIKKFTAPTMPEVMKQIRQDLGPDAMILNSKEIKIRGFLGLFRKSAIEVVAALDPDPIKSNQTEIPNEINEVNSQSLSKGVEEKTAKIESNDNIYREIKQLREMVELQTHSTNKINYGPKYQHVFNHLVNQELDEKMVHQVISNVKKSLDNKVDPSSEALHKALKIELEQLVASIPFKPISYDKRVVHFVGPTGVGKTTTIAKIAAKSMLLENKKVAFITADTYRIGAIEQLKTYAKILDIPIEVAYSYSDYQASLEKFSSFDLVLVDTAGRNYQDKQYVDELKDVIKFNDEMDIYLVLSLTTKSKDLLEIYKKFKPIPIKSLVFTKLDETNSYGNLFNIPIMDKLGISYLTVGQDVPDDIVVPSIQTLCEYIMEDL